MGSFILYLRLYDNNTYTYTTCFLYIKSHIRTAIPCIVAYLAQNTTPLLPAKNHVVTWSLFNVISIIVQFPGKKYHHAVYELTAHCYKSDCGSYDR